MAMIRLVSGVLTGRPSMSSSAPDRSAWTPPGDELRLPLPRLQDHEIAVTSAFRYANTWPTAIELAGTGRVDLDAMVTGHFGLADVESALTAARSEPTAVKVIVRPGD
jgi:L-iditol 2-dehydrogenase